MDDASIREWGPYHSTQVGVGGRPTKAVLVSDTKPHPPEEVGMGTCYASVRNLGERIVFRNARRTLLGNSAAMTS